MSIDNSDIFPKPSISEFSTGHAAFLFRFLSQLQQTSADRPATCDLAKPPQSYIGLIAMAILSRKEKRMLLSEVYKWISDRYSYFRFRGTGWRNSIRHNLSLNDCFVKEDRAPNGKGHYWTIHPANLADFSRGDFRRKNAQWKVKTHEVQTIALHAQNAQVRQWCLKQIERPESPAKKSLGFDVNSLLQEPNNRSQHVNSLPPALIP